MKRRLTAATIAAATALSLAVAPTASAKTEEETALGALSFAYHLAKNGQGVIPATEGAGQLALGSIAAGSSGEQAYYASQVGWGLVWAAVAATGIGAIAVAAQRAGLIKF